MHVEDDCFEECIRSDAEEYYSIINSRNPVAVLGFLGGEFVGDVIGHCPDSEEIKELRLNLVHPDPSVIYMDVWGVLPKFQGRGYGSLLLESFIKTAREKGYKIIDGHYNKNTSYPIIKKYGAEFIKVEHNWYDTGHEYMYCRIRL